MEVVGARSGWSVHRLALIAKTVEQLSRKSVSLAGVAKSKAEGLLPSRWTNVKRKCWLREMPDMTNRPFLSLGRPYKGYPSLPAPNLVKKKPKGLTTPSHDPGWLSGLGGTGKGGGMGTEVENKEKRESLGRLCNDDPSTRKHSCVACGEDELSYNHHVEYLTAIQRDLPLSFSRSGRDQMQLQRVGESSQVLYVSKEASSARADLTSVI